MTSERTQQFKQCSVLSYLFLTSQFVIASLSFPLLLPLRKPKEMFTGSSEVCISLCDLRLSYYAKTPLNLETPIFMHGRGKKTRSIPLCMSYILHRNHGINHQCFLYFYALLVCIKDQMSKGDLQHQHVANSMGPASSWHPSVSDRPLWQLQ